MKTKLVTCLVLSAAFLGGGARAQTVQAAAPMSAAPSVASAPTLTPNQTVYAPRLPSVAELSNIAAAQGLTVERVEQTASQVTAVYRSGNGQSNTVAYLLLPNSPGSATASTVATPTTPAPTVVYPAAPQAVYYEGYGPGYYDYYPRYWYPPVSIGLGFGFRGGYRGGFGRWR